MQAQTPAPRTQAAESPRGPRTATPEAEQTRGPRDRPRPDPPPPPLEGCDPEPAWPRPGPPNGWRRGRVLRTLWAPEAGTGKWVAPYGEALVCVRHREDPLRLRRVVTVEIVVGSVRGRGGSKTLLPHANYTVRLPLRQPALRRAALNRGARPDAHTGLWHVSGRTIQALGLQEWLISLTPHRPPRPAR